MIIVILLIIILILLLFNTNFSKFDNTISVNKKILILTVENRDNDYINLHDKIFNEYSLKHNYEYIRLYECGDNNIYWCKVFKVLEYLLTGKYSYVVWADSDTIINNMDTPLEKFINKFNKDIIIGVDCWGDDCNRIHIINSGVFVVKNSEIGISFLKECILMFNKNKNECVNENNTLNGPWAGRCYEQGTINELLLYSEKYSNDVYIDYSTDMIFNYSPTANRDYENSNALIIHLCIMSSKMRTIAFKKIMEI